MQTEELTAWLTWWRQRCDEEQQKGVDLTASSVGMTSLMVMSADEVFERYCSKSACVADCDRGDLSTDLVNHLPAGSMNMTRRSSENLVSLLMELA